MENFENEINILNLFKEGKITDYVFQQELSNFVGPMSEVHLAESNGKNTASSYAVFTYPEKHVNGIKIIYLIHKDIISNNFYKSDELINKLAELRSYRQGIIKEFIKIVRKSQNHAISLGQAVALYLRMYASTLDTLAVEGKDFLPNDIALSKIIVELSDGINVDANIEKLIIENILPKEVLEVARKLVHDTPEEITTNIKFITDGKELPSTNIGQQEIRDLCSSTFGTREHKEIKYDYTPATNQ